MKAKQMKAQLSLTLRNAPAMPAHLELEMKQVTFRCLQTF